MSIFLFELPTTGAISFSDFCIERTHSKPYTTAIAETTQARANLRAALKESKRAEHLEKDYLKLVKIIDDYIPYLRGIMACVAHDELALRDEPVFSWRTTLSASSLLQVVNARVEIPSLHAEYAFTLLTYAFALSNLAKSTLLSLGSYESDPATSHIERKAKDEKLNFAVTLLCRASGLFLFISETVLVEWDEMGSRNTSRPLDVSREVTAALAKTSLATAQSLAIRKLLSKSAYDIMISPGPPLPKSHPSPALIAKLHLECASLYASARALAKTPGSAAGKKFTFKAKADTSSTSADVHPELRRYLADEAAFHDAIAHKWLGVDGGESSASNSNSPTSSTEGRCGEGVAFLLWAKKDLEALKFGSEGPERIKKENETRKKAELESVNAFLTGYRKMNDSITFHTVPPQNALTSRIPAGRMAVASKLYNPPRNAFGPGSASYVKPSPFKDSGTEQSTSEQEGTYAGAGSYF